MLALAGRRALVTGGSRGIGRAIAAAFLQGGASVAIASRQREAGEAAAGELGAIWLAADLESPEAPGQLVRRAIERLGGLEVLVNNAGQIDRAPALEASEEAWERLYAVNVRAVFRASVEAAGHMRQQGGGKIINLSSVAARLAIPGRAIYGPTKAAVSQLTRVLAVEWAPYGIQVNAIAPGWIRTELNAQFLDEDPERYRRILESIPAGRVGTAEDVAGLSVFLASPASDYLTGQVIEVDGGLGTG